MAAPNRVGPQVPESKAPRTMADMADKRSVRYPRFRTALAGALLVCLGGCSHSHLPPGGRVTTADLRSGKLPVAMEVCVTGLATLYNPDFGTMVVQDRTGAIQFSEVPKPGPWGRRAEVGGEPRPAQSGMTLARPRIKVLGEADLPVARRTSLGEWSRGRVDWQWIVVDGLAHAVTSDRFGVKTLHMIVDGRRVRVRIDLTEGLSSMGNLMGARVRASGIGSRISSHGGAEDFLLLSPKIDFVSVVVPQAPVASLPVVTVADAVRMAVLLPDRRVRLQGSIVNKGAGREQWLRDSTGELRLALQEALFPETDEAEIAAFPVKNGSGVLLEGPLSTRPEVPAQHGVLTSVSQVHALLPSEASRSLPVKLRAVVTYRQDNGVTFVEDETGGIFLSYSGPPVGGFASGDLVEISGTTLPGDFAPVLRSGDVRSVGPGVMPKPKPLNLDTLYTGREDSNWVQAEGYVAAVRPGGGTLQLTVVEGVHTFTAYVDHYGHLDSQVLDARVHLEGVCSTSFNQRRQLVGITMVVPGWRYVTILKPGIANTADIPETRISSLLQSSPEEQHRVRVRGTLTLADAGAGSFVEDSTAGIRVGATLPADIHPGDAVEAAGLAVPAAAPPGLQ